MAYQQDLRDFGITNFLKYENLKWAHLKIAEFKEKEAVKGEFLRSMS